ncbi:MAG: DNA-binding protein [Candidatus Woesearchaeota archaeon]
MDEELEALRQKRMQELQEQTIKKYNEEAQIKQQIELLETTVKSKLTKEAIERYYNIKAANPEYALQVLLMLARTVQIHGGVIDDKKFREFLQKVVPKKREIKIIRK